MRRALVLSNNVIAGVLTETDDMHYIFKYDDAYLVNPEQRSISVIILFSATTILSAVFQPIK